MDNAYYYVRSLCHFFKKDVFTLEKMGNSWYKKCMMPGKVSFDWNGY